MRALDNWRGEGVSNNERKAYILLLLQSDDQLNHLTKRPLFATGRRLLLLVTPWRQEKRSIQSRFVIDLPTQYRTNSFAVDLCNYRIMVVPDVYICILVSRFVGGRDFVIRHPPSIVPSVITLFQYRS